MQGGIRSLDLSAMNDETSVLIILPVFNDWVSAWRLLGELDREFHSAGLVGDVLLVDDGSTMPCPASLPGRLSSFPRVHHMVLWCNCGHQRAIALGLAWGVAATNWERFLVMDCDGEDLPTDAVQLLQEHAKASGTCVVFAERRRRSEGLLFKLGYHGYRWVHRMLTGIAVRVGNFSVVSYDTAGRVVHMAESWNHYAACIFKSRVPRILVPTNRGTRYASVSSMNVPSLVAHGFSALAVHCEVVAVRLLGGALLLTALLFLLTLWMLLSQATSAVTVCVIVVALSAFLQTITGGLSLALTTLGARSQQGFIPGRDFQSLVKRVSEIPKA